MIAYKTMHKRNLVMPVALIGGAIFSKWMGYLTFLSPYLIFIMLFITYCKLSPKDIKISKHDWILLSIQILLSSIAYGLIFWWNKVLAEGIFICLFVPTATAAPVITSLLGGDIKKVVTYSIVVNLFVAIIGPIILALLGEHNEYSIGYSFSLILREVAPLLIGPMLCAFALQLISPKAHDIVSSHQQLSFYIWAISLFIIVGGCVSFTINTWQPEITWLILGLTVGAGVACFIQFYIGRKFGNYIGDTVAGGQSLMQKNTVLAVWLALTYMNPVSSIGPAAYILWQNIVNSWQIARHDNFQTVSD